MEQFTEIAVGQLFPIPVPQQEGLYLELYKTGLACFMQFPGMTKDERWAYKKGFKRYSYFESDTPVPIAIFSFEYNQPIGTIDCNFNARLVKSEVISNFLDGQIKNALDIYVLDGQIVKAIRRSGLDPKAIELFNNTIRKQLATDYTDVDFQKYLSAIYKYSSKELFLMGTIFKHKKSHDNSDSNRSQTDHKKTGDMTNAEMIEKALRGFNNKEKRYHSKLPTDIADWYCYPPDAGHSILCILKCHYKPDMIFTDYLIPVPVKTVMSKGYVVRNEYVVVDLPYSNELGFVDDDNNSEF